MAVMGDEGTRQYRQELMADPRHFGRVRRTITAFARHWGWGELIDPAVMCATEMLANVQRHAGSDECVLLLQSTPSGLRVVVSDDSHDLPVVREPDWSAESGRGMFLLSKTADAWGVEATDSGKDVWVEFRPAEEGQA